jgi:hypothetical protein
MSLTAFGLFLAVPAAWRADDGGERQGTKVVSVTLRYPIGWIVGSVGGPGRVGIGRARTLEGLASRFVSANLGNSEVILFFPRGHPRHRGVGSSSWSP